MRVILLLLLALCAMPVLAATHERDGHTYSDVDYHRLPLFNIYDPVERETERITKYSYEELAVLSTFSQFRKWSDMERFCQSAYLMFGNVTEPCLLEGATKIFMNPSQARAYVSREVVQSARVNRTGKPVLIVDMVFPPWTPVPRGWQ
jgi:hypothetical protein